MPRARDDGAMIAQRTGNFEVLVQSLTSSNIFLRAETCVSCQSLVEVSLEALLQRGGVKGFHSTHLKGRLPEETATSLGRGQTVSRGTLQRYDRASERGYERLGKFRWLLFNNSCAKVPMFSLRISSKHALGRG